MGEVAKKLAAGISHLCKHKQRGPRRSSSHGTTLATENHLKPHRDFLQENLVKGVHGV